MQGFEKKRKAVAVTFAHRQKKKNDGEFFGSLLCSRCLGSSRKKQRLRRKLAFFVCSQACHTTSWPTIFSKAVGISVLMMLRLQVRARFCSPSKMSRGLAEMHW